MIINNIAIIELGECENELRKFYNLSENDIIYMKKVEVKQEGTQIPKIEYDVYCKLSGTKLERLNITICKDIKIQ